MTWALSASVGQPDDISTGTTPRRYMSSGTWLTTLTVPAPRNSLKLPRYVSYDEGFDTSWRRDAELEPRTMRVFAAPPSYRTVDPSASSTRSRQVVVGTASTVVVVRQTFRVASGGKSPSTPAMVQGWARPRITSGAEVTALNPDSTRT